MPPPSTGLVQWVKSDAGVTISPATRVSLWADQSGHGQDWEQVGNNAGNAPYLLGTDSINGIPLITFGTAGGANKGFDTVGSFKNRSGVNMTGADARTVWAVVKPKFDAAYNRMGGPFWSMNTWGSWFFFDPTGIIGPASGAYAWMETGGAFGFANQFTPADGTSGGAFDAHPILVMWFSAGHPDLEFRINNIQITLTPSTMHGVAGPSSQAFLSDTGSVAFLGGLTEQGVYDYDLRTNPTDLSALLSYLSTRYGNSLLVCDCSSEPPAAIHTTGIVAFADHLEVSFNNPPVLSGPALDPSNWFVTVTGPGRAVDVGSVSIVGSTVHLGVTPQTLNANYTLHLPTVGITDGSFDPFTGLFSLDFLGVPTPVTLQNVKVIDTVTIDVIFGVAVDDVTASDPTNYTLDGGLTVVAATRITDFWYRLTNKPRQTDGVTYHLTVSNVQAK